MFHHYVAGGTKIMAMTARLLGISALAVELDRDCRTIARALRYVPADGRSASGGKAWYVSTALRAREHVEGVRNRHAVEDDSDLVALEDAARHVDEALDELRSEPDTENRRRRVRAGLGHVVGEFEQALGRARAGHRPERRMVEQPFVDRLMGATIFELFTLCSWKLKPTK
jgi:hypothetical protein